MKNSHLISVIKEMLNINMFEETFPISANINNVIDKNAQNTDVNHEKFAPQDHEEFMIAVKKLVDDNPDANIPDIYSCLLQKIKLDSEEDKKDMKNKVAESQLRSHIRSILNEALPVNQRMKPGDYRNAKPPTPEELEDLRGLLNKIQLQPGDEGYEGGPDKEAKRKRGSDDEQAHAIVQALKDEFGVDMSGAQFANFDKSLKLRWFATAVLSDKDPNFLKRCASEYVSDLEDAARDSGVLDKELEQELLELEELIVDDPSASKGFSEYLQAEVSDWVAGLNDAQLKDLLDRANSFFKDIPGGILKYNKAGEPVYDDVRTWMLRRQTSKDFTGGGDPHTGGGTALDRFRAGVEHPKFPPEE